MIDPDGFRPNVGIILIRDDGRVFWARRVSRDGWQFPQGGMRSDETPLEAMYRELEEEVGLRPEHVEVLGVAGHHRHRSGRAGRLSGGDEGRNDRATGHARPARCVRFPCGYRTSRSKFCN